MGGQHRSRASSSYPKLASAPVGQQVHSIYLQRLGQFTGEGQYASKNLLSMMDEGRASGVDVIKLSVYSPPDLARPTFKEAVSHKFTPTKVGESFGPSWSTHWFRVQLRVPPELQKKKHLELHWDANNEGLIWDEEGIPLQGLTGGGDRIEWILPSGWRDGKEHVFYIEMACNSMFGNAPGGDTIQPPAPDHYFQLHRADIVAVNLEARALFVDFWIIGDAAREFPGESWQSHEALQVANAIIDAFRVGKQDSIVEGRKIAKQYLGERVDSADVYAGDEDPLVYAIGHCHIDTCWLWPWAETKRKVARSWANQCDLMDRYPEHRFTCSQAQQYKWLEQLYPPLYDRVKTKVKQGNFQPIGGSWVEHDTNMPSGESLVRQFLYGQRFFESHFGDRCKTFWLPDTFGYSSQLPQLCRLAGMTRFFTQKLSWNNINNFPHTTFDWVALDGSQVICHMAPAETYTAEAHFGDVTRSVSQHKSMDEDATSLLVFGKGDGGGGPTFQHLEKLRRCRGLADEVGLLPRVKMGESVDDFFARLEEKAEKGTKFVTWYGELYLELHRGTYTTQANNKRNNRKSEIMLHDLELLATVASVRPGSKSSKSYRYPKKDLDDMWEKLYAEVFERGHKLLKEALSALDDSRESPEGQNQLAVLNTLPWPRTELVRMPGSSSSTSNAQYCLAEATTGLASVCPLSDTSRRSRATVKEIRRGAFVLANDEFEVEVEGGCVTSLWDIAAKREIIPQGSRANQLVVFDDKPLYWQAWDVEVYHLQSRQELPASKTTLVESGPHVVSVMTETKISEESWIKTTISLAASVEGQPSYVEIHGEVEWRESMKFLKVEFPVDIRNTEASYETQFGVVKRPTHYNTRLAPILILGLACLVLMEFSWDMAKFEVCCHKWADLSENGYGVSILNDSKYGFATCGNLMRLSLLRAPKAPDAHADMGRHHIRWAILPHSDGLDSRTVRTAFNFNNPMTVHRASATAAASVSAALSAIRLTGSPSLILDTIKRGEDDEDVSRGELAFRKGRSVIVRIYDSLGGRSRGTLKTTLPVRRVWRTNLLEDDGEEVRIKDGEVEVDLRPFEVATYRLQL
ncbi:MAG: Glycoside hydrolase, 38 vacuolar alpha mannosidase [Caeruleum heppii]|nr:MAG: Glycoside hydrolase, 38 vacuolar alpha mannosidase [Caeruleum heppii]